MKFTRHIKTNSGIDLPAAAVKPIAMKVNTERGICQVQLGVFADSKAADDPGMMQVGGVLFPTNVLIHDEDFAKVVLPAYEAFIDAIKEAIGKDLTRQCEKLAKTNKDNVSAKPITWTK